MAEYYAVLKKAVSGMDTGAGDARRAVYDKARNALIGQLKAIDPPLSTSEISRQRLELEEAIRRVEREVANEAQSVRGRVADSVREAVESATASPQDVFRRAIQDAESRAPVERAPTPARDNGYPQDRNMRERIERQQPADLPPYRDEPPPRSRNPQPQLAPDYDDEWPQEPQQRRPQPEPAPYVDRRDRAARPGQRSRGGYVDEGAREAEPRGARRSRLPAILLTGLILLMVIAAGAIGWSQWDKIAGLAGSLDNNSQTSQSTGPQDSTPPATVDDSASKESDRLGDAGAPGEPVRQAGEAAPAEQAAASSSDTGAGGPALKATLYEEPSAADAEKGVTAIEAKANWRFTNGNDGPEVVADVDVPQRNIKVRMSIRKNSDTTLPASHLVEIQVQTPPDFPGRGIKGIPRIVMKQAEDARGQPVVGASAKVADGLFWIALSAAPTDVENNLKVLKEGAWVDLPIIYDTGQRAILTFEKGPSGASALDNALATWGG
jgi:hypothetical protein